MGIYDIGDERQTPTNIAVLRQAGNDVIDILLVSGMENKALRSRM